ncbi:hypothetical protein AB0I22_01065 [Streptomyces sp. NPDC050610]|uniref:hypothetical protein n=1 Tax=Streptomyces sp. NPDC050610 TaxID=3157097 RepID=UPI00343E641B
MSSRTASREERSYRVAREDREADEGFGGFGGRSAREGCGRAACSCSCPRALFRPPPLRSLPFGVAFDITLDIAFGCGG